MRTGISSSRIENVDAAQRFRWIWRPSSCRTTESRVEIGTMAPIDVVQAQAEEATRRQTLVNARGDAAEQRTRAQAPDRQRHGGRTVERDDRPDRSAGDDARADRSRSGGPQRRWRTASTSRSPSAAWNRTKSAMRNLRNQTLPASGPDRHLQPAGPRRHRIPARQGIGGKITSTIPGGYFDALSNIGGFTAPTWSLRFQVRASRSGKARPRRRRPAARAGDADAGADQAGGAA